MAPDVIFLRLVNLSISAGWLILAVMLARLLLHKAPKWAAVLLWGLVAVRLICPLSVESPFSLLPKTEWIVEMPPDETECTQPEAIHPGEIMEKYPGTTVSVTVQSPEITVGKRLRAAAPLPYLWLGGAAALLLFAGVSAIRLKRRVGASIPVCETVFACDEVRSPFILGILKPVIYVPSSIDGETLEYVIAHETAHIRRHDHWWKPLGYLLLAVYWFHPLIWLSYVLFCRDLELACDERVVRKLDGGGRAAYSQALLNCAVPRRRVSVFSPAFGEVSVKTRVRSVLRYRKPAFWLIPAAVVVCIVLGVCFLTAPKRGEPDLSFLNVQNAVSIAAQQSAVDVIAYPETAPDGDGLICLGVANGAALARYLDWVSWRERRAPAERLASPGSVVFVLSEQYRITIYRKPRLAEVCFQGDTRFYRTGRSDYREALSLLCEDPSGFAAGSGGDVIPTLTISVSGDSRRAE